MDFAESELHRDIRASVRAIAEKYGHTYYQRTAADGSRSEELWNEVAEAGFIGVNLPEEYGGGGLGISELAVVGEELAAHGDLECGPLPAPRGKGVAQPWEVLLRPRDGKGEAQDRQGPRDGATQQAHDSSFRLAVDRESKHTRLAGRRARFT